MLDQIIDSLVPYTETGFITDIHEAPHVGPDAFEVAAGDSRATINCTDRGIEIAFGEGKAAVLSGVTVSQAVRFIVQALGRKDFELPTPVVSAFQKTEYPDKVTDAVLAPIGITQHRGESAVVYKDAQGRYYIHEDECRVSLKLYKELYDRNSEGELLRMPKLFQSAHVPVLTNKPSMVSEATAAKALSFMGLIPLHQAAAAGVPVRLSALAIPSSGVLKVGDTSYRASEIASSLTALTEAWETALKGEPVKQAAQATYTAAELRLVRSSDVRAELAIVFEASWPTHTDTASGKFIEERRVILPKAQTLALSAKFGDDLRTVDPAVIKEALDLTKDLVPVTEAEAAPFKSVRVKDAVLASVKEAGDKGVIVSSAGADKSFKDFAKEAGVPEWMSVCSSFATMAIRQ